MEASIALRSSQFTFYTAKQVRRGLEALQGWWQVVGKVAQGVGGGEGQGVGGGEVQGVGGGESQGVGVGES